MKSPSQRAIAKKANVSLASVSFALGSNQSNQEKLSKATRDRILKTAAEMGYQSNPLISTWMAGLRSGRASPPKATLGWINDYPDRDWWNSGPYNRTLRESAIERARELGYTLEDIWLPDMAGVAPEAYVSKCIPILRERGISGVLLPHLDYAARAEVEWPDCAVVVIGKPERLHPHLHETRQQPDARQTLIHHQVNSDFFHNAALAYRSLATAGYRRVGLTISLDHDMASGLLISSAVETETRLMAPDRQVPVFRHKTPLEFEGLDAWIRKCRPDAILAVQAETRKEIKRLGMRIPEEVGLAHMNLEIDGANWSGINCNSAVIGASAVDLLASCLQRKETGVPDFPKEVLIKGTWLQGRTTKPIGE